MPLFSIIVVHYQGTVPHNIYLRGQKCLEDQTLGDFEVLRYHDGPLLDETVKFPEPIQCTPQRYNDWGHSLRDIGIREAKGDYILHFNADNYLYPNALEEIAYEIRRPCWIKHKDGWPLDTNDIIIFPIKMFGMVRVREMIFRVEGFYKPIYMIMPGCPAKSNYIDCMQLVMKRELWLAEGGWSKKHATADGELYEKFVEKYGCRHVSPVLGEHY